MHHPGGRASQTKFVLILAVTTFIIALYVVRRLVLSPIVTQPAAQQQHRVSWGGGVGWGGPGHYVVTPTRVSGVLKVPGWVDAYPGHYRVTPN